MALLTYYYCSHVYVTEGKSIDSDVKTHLKVIIACVWLFNDRNINYIDKIYDESRVCRIDKYIGNNTARLLNIYSILFRFVAWLFFFSLTLCKLILYYLLSYSLFTFILSIHV